MHPQAIHGRRQGWRQIISIVDICQNGVHLLELSHSIGKPRSADWGSQRSSQPNGLSGPSNHFVLCPEGVPMDRSKQTSQLHLGFTMKPLLRLIEAKNSPSWNHQPSALHTTELQSPIFVHRFGMQRDDAVHYRRPWLGPHGALKDPMVPLEAFNWTKSFCVSGARGVTRSFARSCSSSLL